jgi:hypothetical protein
MAPQASEACAMIMRARPLPPPPARLPARRPILFRAPLVRAIMGGLKHQTRRPVRAPQGWRIEALLQSASPRALCTPIMRRDSERPVREVRCPYGERGDLLWVKETWARPIEDEPELITYRADGDAAIEREVRRATGRTISGATWRSSLLMPRRAARIWLRVESVRAQPLEQITCSDVRAEGIGCPAHDNGRGRCSSDCAALIAAFRRLWDSIYHDQPALRWSRNPVVWAVTFSPVSRPADA